MMLNSSGVDGVHEAEAAAQRGGSHHNHQQRGLKKGPWTAAEDGILMEYVKKHGEGNWNAVQKNSGLARCGKSCRLRWANHLRPNLKKGSLSPDEERLIIELHAKFGNKWARMASQVNFVSFSLVFFFFFFLLLCVFYLSILCGIFFSFFFFLVPWTIPFYVIFLCHFDSDCDRSCFHFLFLGLLGLSVSINLHGFHYFLHTHMIMKLQKSFLFFRQ